MNTVKSILTALAVVLLAAGAARAQSTVVDQVGVPIPATTNTTGQSEWLMQSFAVTGATCYQAFYRQPGLAVSGGGGLVYPGGLHCVPTASSPAAIAGSASPFPITGQQGAQGGAISVTGGTSTTSANAGGAASLVGGPPGVTGVGGAVSVAGGAGGATSGAGGAAAVAGGAGTAGNGAGGVASMTGGAGQGTGNGGTSSVVGGASGAGATGAGGAVASTGGAALSVNGAGGAATVTGGAGAGTGNGGAVTITGGAAGATGTGGTVGITAGAPTAGNGSTVTITGSSGAGGTNSGGNVNLVPGLAVSTGAPGVVQVNGDAGLICGAYYFTGTPAATNQVFFLATRPLYVVEVSNIFSAAAGATSTLDVIHDTSTNAPAAGTSILSATFNLNATANTTQVGSLVATVATKTLAAGDRLSVKFNNAIGSSAGVVVEACMAPQ